MEEAKLIRKYRRICNMANDLGMEIDILGKEMFRLFEKFGDGKAIHGCRTLEQMEGCVIGYGSKNK